MLTGMLRIKESVKGGFSTIDPIHILVQDLIFLFGLFRVSLLELDLLLELLILKDWVLQQLLIDF
jgi:hypothetical protein